MRRLIKAAWVWLVTYGWLIALVLTMIVGVLAFHANHQRVEEVERLVEFVCDSVNETNSDLSHGVDELLVFIEPDSEAAQALEAFRDNDLQPIECALRR